MLTAARHGIAAVVAGAGAAPVACPHCLGADADAAAPSHLRVGAAAACRHLLDGGDAVPAVGGVVRSADLSAPLTSFANATNAVHSLSDILKSWFRAEFVLKMVIFVYDVLLQNLPYLAGNTLKLNGNFST